MHLSQGNNMDIIELLTPHYEAAWLPWAVQYFFLIGIATGAALLGTWSMWAPEGSAAARARPLIIVLLAVTAATAPVALLADLHQPARFWHFYAHFTPWSWMSVGALLLPAFVTLALGLCVLWWLDARRWLRPVSLLLALSAATIVLYTGAELAIVRSRPLWHNPWAPLNLALTAWLAAVGCLLILSRWIATPDEAGVRRWLGRLGQGLSLALVATAGSWVLAGLLGKAPSFDSALDLYRHFPVWRISLWLSIVLGALTLALWSLPSLWLDNRAGTLALGLVVCAAAWGFRWALFMGVQGVPKYGAGLYVYHMPLGGEGLMGIIGIFGLCVTVLMLALWALDLRPGADHQPKHMPDQLSPST